MVDYPTQIIGEPEKMAAYRQAWNEVAAELRDELPASVHGVPDSKIKQEGVLQKALEIYKEQQSSSGPSPGERHQNRYKGRSGGDDMVLVEETSPGSRGWSMSTRRVVSREEAENNPLMRIIRDVADTPEARDPGVLDPNKDGGDTGNTKQEENMSNNGIIGGAAGATDGQKWDYPDAINTSLEKKAWRKAGGNYAKAQRLIKQMKRAKRDPPDPPEKMPDPPDPHPPKKKKPDPQPPEKMPVPTDDSNESGDSLGSVGSSGSGTLNGIDTRTAALGIGAAAAAALAYGGIR